MCRKTFYLTIALLVCSVFSTMVRADNEIKRIKTPGGGIVPRAEVDASGTVHLIYFKGDKTSGNIFYVRKKPEMDGFSSPIQVNSIPNSAIVMGTVRAPHLAVTADGQVHVAWMGSKDARPSPENAERPMLYARLNEGGRSFTEQKNVLNYAGPLDGGGTVAAHGNTVYVLWHANPKKSGEQNRQVFIARSNDGGRSFSKEKPATGRKLGVCGCCGINATTDSNGNLISLFRSATNGTRRDTMMLQLAAGNSGPSIKRLHPWQKSACPMSSFSLRTFSEGTLLAWERAGQVYFGMYYSNGGNFAGSASPPGGNGTKRKHPAIVANENAILMAWTEGTGFDSGGQLAWRLFRKSDGKSMKQGGTGGKITGSDRPAVYARPDGGFTIVH